MKKITLGLLLSGLLLLGVLLLTLISGLAGKESSEERKGEAAFSDKIDIVAEIKKETVSVKEIKEIETEEISVSDISFCYREGRQIEIMFSALEDAKAESYYLMRKEAGGENDWSIRREITADTQKAENTAEDAAENTTENAVEDQVCYMENGIWHVTDETETNELRQYIYRVDVKTTDAEEIFQGREVLASNAYVCIDPGHFGGKNLVTDEESYGYAEGDYTLKIGLALREYLKGKYGIDSCMTRDSGSITLEEYTNEELDSGHISLRGRYAGEMGCDLFVSLHTNANGEDANGYPTFLQPIEANKVVILANTVASKREDVISIGNHIGTGLSGVNYDRGLAPTEAFDVVQGTDLKEWTAEFNDGLDIPGSVRYRLKKDRSGDYYGVLRGASEAGVPGLIIEHGMHTVAALRKEAMTTDLYSAWAEADADGIAAGWGFLKSEN